MKSRTLELMSIALLATILTISYSAAVYAHRVTFNRAILQAKNTQHSLSNITEQQKTDTHITVSQPHIQNAQVPHAHASLDQIMQETAQKTDFGALLLLLLLAFIAGIITSFTPCVYPMIPVTIGILQSQGSRSIKQTTKAALAYVLGIASVYATLGYMSAKASVIFGQWATNPWVIGLVIIFFIYLALSLFDIYDIYIPRFLRQHTQLQTGGSLLKIFFFGALSGTIASPCMTPALAVILGVAAKQGNPIIGFLTLFAFSLGEGLILIIIGVSSGALTLLPRSGEWMLQVKHVMGFGMLAACVYFLHGKISGLTAHVLYMLVCSSASIYFVAFEKIRNTATYLLGILTSTGTIVLAYFIIKSLIS